MGMAAGGGGGVRSEINVTPLVDVVLVLLIIFMVVTPLLQMGYETNIPPKAQDDTVQSQPPPDQVIIRMDRDGKTYINKEQIDAQNFPFRLSQQLQNRGGKMVFFAADGELQYEKVSNFLDLCHNNGATNLAIVLEDLDESGSTGSSEAP
jgi:biopolymer transport protein TolR